LPEGVGTAETEVESVVEVETEVLVSVVVASAPELDEPDGAGVLLAPDSGTDTVMPFSAQVSSTLEMTSFCSASLQAFLTQGVTAAKSESAFLQWQAKSSRLAQPSLVKGLTKQLKAHLGMSGSCAVATAAKATRVAATKFFILIYVKMYWRKNSTATNVPR
jgi:hypothetical protein